MVVNNKSFADNVPSEKPIDFEQVVRLMFAVGSAVEPIVALVSATVGFYEQKNQQLLIQELKSRIYKLEHELREKKITRLASEDGQELLKYSLIKSKVCYQDAQIMRMVDIIMAAVDNDKLSKKDANVLIDIVSSLNAKEAEFFVWLAKGIVDMYNQDNDKPHFFERLAWSEDRIEYVARKTEFYDSYTALFNRLEAKGLVNHVMEIISKPQIYNNRQVGNTIEPKSHFQLTYFGILYVKLINNMLETAEF